MAAADVVGDSQGAPEVDIKPEIASPVIGGLQTKTRLPFAPLGGIRYRISEIMDLAEAETRAFCAFFRLRLQWPGRFSMMNFVLVKEE